MPPKAPRPSSERRRTPRIRTQHELQLQVGDSDVAFAARAIDISLGGIYCTIDRHLPPFTKVMLTLTLPLFDAKEKKHVFRVPVEGVVVRMDPEEPSADCDSYECALAFMHGDPDVELVIAKFVLQQLARGMDEDDE